MSKLRAVVAGVVVAAVSVVMPGGWVAFAADPLPSPPSGELNDVFVPADSAGDGSLEVGEVPTDQWVLAPLPVAQQPLEATPRSRPVPESTSAAPATPNATEAPAAEDDADADSSEADPVEQNPSAEAAAPESDAESAPETQARAEVIEAEEPPVANLAPAGTPVGAPGLGALPWFSFDQVPVTTDTVARVNLGNGNLLLTGNDGQLNGPGLPLRNDRFYNGLSTSAGAFGSGWSSALSATDVGLQVSGSTATYRGPNGYTAVFTASGTNWIAPAGFEARLTNESYGKKLVFNETGEQIRFNTSGWVTHNLNRNGVGNTYSYSGGKLSSVTEASGRSYTMGYASYAPNQINTITDSAGRVTTYSLNQGKLTFVVSPGAYYEKYGYDSSNRLSSIEWYSEGDGDGRITFAYDSQSRVTGISQGGTSTPVMTSTSYTYNAGQTVVTDANGNATTYSVDSSGRVTSATDALGRTRSQTYNAGNEIATSTDALASGNTPGNQTVYSYDALGNSTGTTLPTGAAASATYALGTGCTNTGGDAYQVKCSTDPSGNGKRFDYDAAGNTTKVTDTTTGGTGAVTQEYTYAQNGYCGYGAGFNGQVCSSKDGNGNTTIYSYDAAGNLIGVNAPAPMGDTAYTYDSLGRVTEVTDGNGDTTSYAYNARDEIVTTTFDDGGILYTYWYDNGLKARDSESTDNTGPLEITIYNTVGWTTRFITKTDIGSGPNTVIVDYSYDPVGNTTAIEDTDTGKVTYGYDAANQLITVADPGKTCPTTAGSPASSGCVKIAYNANGVETSRTLPGNATITTTLDNSSRPTRITVRDTGNTVRVDTGYTYNVPGQSGAAADRANIQTRTAYLEEGLTAGAVTTYGYDSLNRVTSAIEKVGTTTSASWAYTYDAAGNRTQQIRAGSTGAAAGTVNYGYNAANQLISATGSSTTWTYDAAGNQTRKGLGGQTMAYNSRGAVIAIGDATFTAWGQGNSRTLTRTTVTPVVTGYLNTPTGLMSGGGNTGARAYTRTPDGEITGTRYTNSRYYYSTDHLGSVTGIFNQAGTWIGGYTYSPYGEQRTATNTTVVTDNAIRYIGGYYDVNRALYRLGARYYDPSLGRFTQTDPSGQEGNPYSYAACNPINSSDPSGLDTTACEYLTGATATAGTISGALGAGALLSAGTVIGGISLGTLATAGAVLTAILGIEALLACGFGV